MKVVTNQQHYYDIAEVIRAKTGITTPLKPAEMAPALAAMTPADALPHAEEFTFGANLALPVIPDSVLAGHPKAVIFMVTSQESTQFVYIATTSAFYRVAGELLGMEYDVVIGSLGEGVKASDSGAGTWGDQFPVTAGTAGLMIGTEGNNTYSLVWANHDIYEVLAVDATTGTITTGAVYFAASADVVTGTAEEYRIQKESLDGIGEQVNRLCNTVEPMPPERMEEKLSDLDITLQDIHITPSDEEQIIKPEGHYGFYKITVEAVESSGTGGGGTPGEGEGGEDGDQILSGDYVGFGNEYVEEEVATGFGVYRYGSGDVHSFEAPAPPTDGYCVIRDFKTPSFCYVTSAPLESYNGSALQPTDGSPITVYEWNANSGAVSWEQTGTRTVIYTSYVTWNNYDIYHEQGYVIIPKCPDFEETVITTTVKKPVEYDAEYKISGESLNNIITLAQDVTGTTEPMTLDEAYAALDKYFNPEPTE